MLGERAMGEQLSTHRIGVNCPGSIHCSVFLTTAKLVSKGIPWNIYAIDSFTVLSSLY